MQCIMQKLAAKQLSTRQNGIYFGFTHLLIQTMFYSFILACGPRVCVVVCACKHYAPRVVASKTADW